MKKTIIVGIFMLVMVVSMVSALDAGLKYWVTLNYDEGRITYDSVDVKLASNTGDLNSIFEKLAEDAGVTSDETKFYAVLYDVAGREVQKERVWFPLDKFVSRTIECVNTSDDGTFDYIPGCDTIPPYIREKKATVVYTKIGYLGIGSHINVVDGEDRTLLKVPLNEFWDYCGDDVCSASESYLTCFKDCDEERKVYGLISGETREFNGYYSSVSGTGEVDVFVSEGLCENVENNCVEFLETDYQINVYVKKDTDILVQDSGIYNVNVIYEGGDGTVYFEADNGQALITKDSIQTSFSDWSDLPVITKSYVDADGRQCTEIFDPNTKELLIKDCGY